MNEPDNITEGTAGILARELEYHEKLYAGTAQKDFAGLAVRAFRKHLVARVLRVGGAGRTTRVLSVGCGIGDTETVMAPHVREIVGVDISPSAIRQARADAARLGLHNLHFIEGTLESAGLEPASFDLIIGIFFLHHVPDAPLALMPRQIERLLVPGGCFYGIDPSRHRLSGKVGSLLIPKLMKKHQSPDERELDARELEALFGTAGFACRTGYYDFVSTPVAGLFTGWRAGYLAARLLDDLLVRVPLLKRFSSNLEIVARKPC